MGQTLIVYLIVALAVIYAGILIYRSICSRKRGNKCDTCPGCILKNSKKKEGI